MKRFSRSQRGFTLIELLIVVAILAVLASVVTVSVLGLMGRGGAQAYDTDQKVIELAVSTFYSDVHDGLDVTLDPDGNVTPTLTKWGCTASAEPRGHYYPTALAYVGQHRLYVSTEAADEDDNNPGSFRVLKAHGEYAGDTDISAHAIWMGLLVNGDGTSGCVGAAVLEERGAAAPLVNEVALYLQEIPDSASLDNGAAATKAGGYTWIVGRNGNVYGAYESGDKWYGGFAGVYP